MCMGVKPGFSGQPFLEEADATIQAVASQKLKAVLAVDGGVSEENIRRLQKQGVGRFVISSQLFASNAVESNLHHFIQLLTQQGGT
jgi:ribulose-phosphate 3-epimerase